MPPGDGWAWCAQGHRHWGLHGAAGLLVQHRADDGSRWLLMQHRAGWSHHGGTWGLLGGARMPEETALEAAGREAWEEAGLATSEYTVTDSYLDDHGGWSYTTVLATAASMREMGELTAESVEVNWIRLDLLDELPLHPGFAASWPAVSSVLAG
ncbi:MAG TPA: NUDIX domain-containing protein [Pseudonocardia sp.]|nr:NUDIX domain-containing protein [Pseudonocardia sp.]